MHLHVLIYIFTVKLFDESLLIKLELKKTIGNKAQELSNPIPEKYILRQTTPPSLILRISKLQPIEIV